MFGLKGAATGVDATAPASRWSAPVMYLLVAVLVLVASRFVLDRLGIYGFVIALGGLLGASLYLIISLRWLTIPFFVWVLTIGGFRYLWSMETEFLPDLYLDRIAMIWLFLVFLVKVAVERRPLRGTFAFDLLLLVHCTYLFVQVYQHEMQFFGIWVASVVIPYAAYFAAKNVISGESQVRALFRILLVLSIYYNVTSIAEKFDLNWLIWPKYIITDAQREFIGRSQGPFMQAPLFGTVIGMLLPVHLYFMAVVRRNVAKILLAISLLTGLAGLYFTYTRGSWLAGIAALGAAAFLNRRAYLKFLLPVMIVAPVVAIGFLGLTQDKFMKERFWNEDTIGSRVGTAVTVLRVWRDHPLFGAGFFQYRNVRENYIEPVEVPGLPVIRFVQFRRNAIHDIYLGPMAETGLVGTALQFGIYFMILRIFLRKYAYRKYGDRVASLMIPVLGGVMFGYLVGGLAFDYRFFAIVGTLFMVSAGVVDGYDPARGAVQADGATSPELAGAGAAYQS